jgi:phenylacetate-CoA ligase
VAFTCERGAAPDGKPGLLHFTSHLVLNEVVDPETGEHVDDGEFGEVVVTPLGIEGAPLIRFATGDRARFLRAERCSCGRPFDGIEAGSVSRYDDMIKVKGINLWPSSMSAIIDRESSVTEHRITAALDGYGRETLTVEVEFQTETPPGQRVAAIDALRKELSASTSTKVAVVEWDESTSLAAAVLGEGTVKAKRWRDLRVR